MAKQLALKLLDDVLAVAGQPPGPGAMAPPPQPVRISVTGLCKNAGKTVTLNHLIRAAAVRRLPLGLVSTGRDGEERDAVTELPKPRIWAPAGSLIATAEQALATSSARVERIGDLPLATPFGPVVLGRVTAAGEVLLIGPGSASRLGHVLERLEAHGARLTLVDGSFDRMAAAAPAITGNVILTAGAAYSHSMATTVAQVRHLLDLFDLSPWAGAAPGDASGMAPFDAAPASLILPDGAIVPLAVPGALGDPTPLLHAVEGASGHADSGTPVLALRGALGDRFVAALLQRQQALDLLVPDPTHILVERNLWRRWRRQGGRVYVGRPVRLIAVTTNAYSPVGKGYGAAEFLAAVAAVAGRPVYDLEAGLAWPSPHS